MVAGDTYFFHNACVKCSIVYKNKNFLPFSLSSEAISHEITIFVAMKIFLTILGLVSFALAVAGIFLPLLPTTPLLLLAAWCFVRSSPHLYGWLMRHPKFGPYIRNFRESRAIPLRVKVVSVALVWLTILLCVFMVVEQWWWAQLLLLALAAAISWHILSYKTLK